MSQESPQFCGQPLMTTQLAKSVVTKTSLSPGCGGLVPRWTTAALERCKEKKV